ncbi:hypothetical protein HEP87_64455 [Streptomyces sp. S1D4-11]
MGGLGIIGDYEDAGDAGGAENSGEGIAEEGMGEIGAGCAGPGASRVLA